MSRIEVRVPDIGMQTEEIKFGCWLKAAGEAVAAGEDLFEVEADKATVVCEAEVAGVFAEAVTTGGLVETGDIVGYIDAR